MAAASVAQIHADLVLQTAKFKASLGDAQSQTRQFAGQMKGQMREAQGSVALLGEEFGVTMPRHLRTFVTQLPGVAQAMSAAFDAVAVIALIGFIVKAGEKIAEFLKKNDEAAKKNQEAWTNVHQSLQIQNDDLEVTKARLEDAIAKLEHKPENRLKEAIAEARAEADKLGKTLDDAVKQIQEALKGEVSGTFAQLVLKQTGGTQTAGVMDKLQLQLANITNGYVQGDQTQLRQQAIQQALTALAPIIAAAHTTVANNQRMGTPLENTSSLKEYTAASEAARDLTLAQSVATNSVQISGLQGQLGNDQAAKDALEALKAAQEKQVQAMRDGLTATKAARDMSIEEEVRYYYNAAAIEGSGSLVYIEAMKEANKLIAGVQKDTAEEQDKLRAAAMSPSESFAGAGGKTMFGTLTDDDLSKSTDYTKDIQDQSKAITDWLKNLNEGVVIQTKNSTAFAEASLKMEEQRGTISKLSAAQQQLTLDNKAYQDQLTKLQSAHAAVKASGATPEEKNAALSGLQNQIDTLNGQAQIKLMADAMTVYNNTWKGGIEDIYNTIIQKSNETMNELKSTTMSFISGINEEFAKGITGQQMKFKPVFQGAAQSLAKTGLEKGEGAIASMFGLGKKDGSTQANALWVQMAGMSSGLAGMPSFAGISNGPTITGPNGQTTADVASAAGGIGGFFSKLMGMLGGHFASGGDVMGGVPIDVGELGPEQFVPYTNGRIVPNNQMNSNSPSIGYVDARGTDPAMVNAAVYRGMMQAHAQAVADSTNIMTQKMRRTPH